ncbi:MAG: AIR carboxylase family protein, partial [Cetobacterium sp.]
IESKTLKGIDSLLSIVQMPGGVPVATVSIGGAKNAGLLAVKILGIKDSEIGEKIKKYRENMERMILDEKI